MKWTQWRLMAMATLCMTCVATGNHAIGMERTETAVETRTIRGGASGKTAAKPEMSGKTTEDTTSRDNFADARPISGASGESSFDNAGYTKESGEPTHSSLNRPGGASAWAVWTAPSDGDWTFSLSGRDRISDDDMDTQLAVYTGDAVSNLTLVAANDDANRNGGDCSSRVSFPAEKGVTYHIAMDSYQPAWYSSYGTLKLEWKEGFVHSVQAAYTIQWVPLSGGRQEMEVDSSTNWTVVECSDWITPIQTTGRPVDSVAYNVSSNGTGKERTGYVRIQAGNSPQVSITLRQHVLDFATTKDEALDLAWRENKRILVIHGREACYNTGTTMFSTFTAAGVRALLDVGFVVWYSNCDRQSDALPYVGDFKGEWLPTLAIVDPLDAGKGMAGLDGLQSAEAIQSLLQSAPSWPGLPNAKISLGAIGETSATATTKVRMWGEGATLATVTLETSDEAAFASVKSSRQLGTITQIWTEQEWTFGPPSETEAAFCRLRVTSGDWSAVSDVVEFIPLGVALDNGTLAFTYEGGAPWRGQTAVSHDGVDAVRCANPATNGPMWERATSSLKTTIQGPGQLSFWWKADGNEGGYFDFIVDGQEKRYMSATNCAWEMVAWSFTDNGSHTAEWKLKRYNNSYYNATGWVDQVTWKPGGEIVHLDRQGGYSPETAAVVFQEEAMPPVSVPERMGYAFGGYYSAQNGAGVQYYTASGASARNWEQDGPSILYAHWIPNTYAVTLDRQGGTGGTSNVTATYGEKPPVIDIPKSEGLDFAGYYDETGGNGTQYYYAFGKGARNWDIASDTTLYAHWVEHIPTTVVDGVVYSADKTTLIRYPEEKEGVLFTVPATVTNLAPGCFAGTKLRAVRFSGNAPTAKYTCFGDGGLLGYCTKGTTGWTDKDEDEAWGAWWNGIRMYPIPEGGQETVSGTMYHYEIVDGIVWVFVVTNGAASLEYKPRQSGGWGEEACIPWGIQGEVAVPSALGGYPVRRIGVAALSYGSYTSVTISDTVRAIAESAFIHNGVQFKSIAIPNGVTNIGACAFAYNFGLQEILVERGNPVYESENGVLYAKGKSFLVEAPPGMAGHFSVPGTVTDIGRGAFVSCAGLTSISIPDSVTSIGASAFMSCSGLTSMTIPDSVTSIGDYAFYYCSGLKELRVPKAWEGTPMLDEVWRWVGDPEGCKIIYYEPGKTGEAVAVPDEWIYANAREILEANGWDYAAAANAEAANGMAVWKCYLVGLSTTDAGAKFKVKSISVKGGKVVVMWDPDLNEGGTKEEREYTVEGAETLGGTWGATNAASRFFRVKVEMPQAAASGTAASEK